VVAASVQSLHRNLSRLNASVVGRKSYFFKELTKMRNWQKNREVRHIGWWRI